MKIKLHWKLTIIFCIAIIFGLFIGYGYLIFNLNRYIEHNLEINLRHQILAGRDFLESCLNAQGLYSANIDAIADRIGAQQELRVTIISKDGKVLGDSELNPPELARVENHLDRPEIQDVINKGFGISKRYSHTIKKYLYYMAIPFGKGEQAGFLRYAVPISYIVMLEEKLRRTIIAALLLVFLLSIAFSFVISFTVSSRLEELAKIARAVAQGDFSKKPYIYSKDEIGDLAMALSYMSDEIKNKIDIIRKETAKLDVILSSMFEGIMVVDAKGYIVMMNPSLRKMFLVDSDPEGKTPIEVVRNPQIQDVMDKIIKEKCRFFSKEINITYPEEKVLKINAVEIIKKDILEGGVLVFHDITELRRLERIRQDFVANVSHELRTPVSNIKGYAETLLEGAMDDKENAKEFMGIIYQEASRLSNLIDDLLDLSKIESGRVKMEFIPLDIAPVLKRTFGVLEKTIKEKNLSVSINIPEGLPQVLADEKRLNQVFLNLLDNAVKYTNEGGAINVVAFESGRFVQIDITDTGIGIPEIDLPRIFERFYRVDKARSRELGGTGLGLSIVKHIVLSHGGQVWVKSRPGQGSTFSFTIPKA